MTLIDTMDINDKEAKIKEKKANTKEIEAKVDKLNR
jgi:hypothetical protein